MSETGFTKARSMGPVAEAVERMGGSAARLFRRADLPLRLIETPEQMILLKDQLGLVESAAREIGDAALPLRLSLAAGMAGLGAFGRRVRAAATLEEAILRCNGGIVVMLQTATDMRLERRGDFAVWSYGVTDSARVGRRENELLALGYMLDALRHFCGRRAAPARVELPGLIGSGGAMRDIFGCEASSGARAALILPIELLGAENPGFPGEEEAPIVATPQDFVTGVEHLVRLQMLVGRPALADVARRLGLPSRTMQRRLQENGARFEALLERVTLQKAREMLAAPDVPITRIAFDLGYSDPAHFTRAMLRATGETPRELRRRLLAAGPSGALALPRSL